MSYESVKALREKEDAIVADLELVRQQIQEELAWSIQDGDLIIEASGLEVWIFADEIDG